MTRIGMVVIYFLVTENSWKPNLRCHLMPNDLGPILKVQN